MIDRIRLRPVEGRRATWNGTNADEIREVAGNRFLRVWERFAVVMNNEGAYVHLSPGWSVVAWEGGLGIAGPTGIFSDAAFHEVIS